MYKEIANARDAYYRARHMYEMARGSKLAGNVAVNKARANMMKAKKNWDALKSQERKPGGKQ